MRKITLLALLLSVISQIITAQTYNNEWIDYSKTYYKFTIGTSGTYRINQTNLPAALVNTPVEHFQLWRNGVQVPIFTSVNTGSLPVNGYIEFIGEQNDGVPDKVIYRNPNFQLSDRLSLFTDTAAYFLTVNTNTAQNLRFITTANNVAANTLPAETFFIHTQRINFKENIHRGYGENVGERVTSSSYDIGEGWCTRDINQSNPYEFSWSNLFPSSSGPTTASVQMGVSGISFFSRNITVRLNNAPIINNQLLANQESRVLTANFALGTINSATNNIRIEITPTSTGDNVNRIGVSFLEISYARQFNFGNLTQFAFSLPASTNPNGTYIEITNFNSSNAAVLYDVTNNRRFVADVSGSTLRFALPFSAVTRRFVLVSQNASAINNVVNFTQRNFINYSATTNQGNYLIISNKLLGLQAGGAVDQYRAYRASATGGSFNAKIYDIDELTDQFAFGIKKHPLAVKNFARFAKQLFTTNPTHLFIIGKGVAYDQYRYNESSPFADRLNLVPTFGWPASDALLVSDGVSVNPLFMVGRLAAVSPSEINVYLQKVQQYEIQFASTLQTIQNKLWTKHIMHVAGSNDLAIETLLINYLNQYKQIARDTLLGANVFDFNTQVTGGGATPAVVQQIKNLFKEGVSLLTYFGHSAATQLDYNLNNPEDYDNTGKYPMFLLNGCNAGNFFDFDTTRFSVVTSFAERFVFSNQRGAIGVIASTHFGLTGFLHAYSTAFYNSLSREAGYNNFVGRNMIDALAPLQGTDFFSRIHAEQFLLHGDPAIKINAHSKPDFAIEDQNIAISPSVLTVADNKFTLKTKIYNIGKAQAARLSGGGDSLQVIIKWQRGDGSLQYLYNGFLKPSIRYGDSLTIEVPINAARDKGNNCITILLDSVGRYDELSKANNTLTKCFFVFDDDIQPVTPAPYAIINTATTKLYASTANPLATERTYVMELDTTALFNSTSKIIRTVQSKGGVVEFDAGITFKDSTVYYWRVAPANVSGTQRWNKSSFIYLSGTEIGYNQSHVFQQLNSVGERIQLDSFTRNWNYNNVLTNLTITQGVFPFTSTNADFSVFKNGLSVVQSGCLGYSVRITLFDGVTLQPYYNQAVPGVDSVGPSGGFMGSSTINCNKKGRQFNFEFPYNTLAGRNAIRDFLNWIPNGVIPVIRVNLDAPFDADPVAIWKADANPNGSLSNTLYGKLVESGFTALDSFNYPRPWVYIYQKGNNNFVPRWKFGFNTSEVASLDATVTSKDTLGFITSPLFGPATAWKQLVWRGSSLETANNDVPLIDVIGITSTGTQQVLFSNIGLTQQNFNLNTVNAATYPYLQLRMSNKDAVTLTPYQLRYWRLLADPAPEGAVSPNIVYSFKDTLEKGETLNFALTFKNIGKTAFADSLPVRLQITNAAGVVTNIPVSKLKKPLNPNDTATIRATINTANLQGLNTLYVIVNENMALPEQQLSNNFLFNNFFIKADVFNPVIDVTFDGSRILNGDIVSATPLINVALKDEAKFMLLDDTAGITIQLRYPNFTTRRFRYGTDTLSFIPASQSNDNTAVARFKPVLTEDGEYELIVTGKDKSGNFTGSKEYRVAFNVTNKPMISDVFNYPNPFTTSTAFVFTLTGNQIPNMLRIQILTVTGKVVKEINKEELGPLRIGRNITEYKWDGTDMYGQKLANGVYLYRIITNINGNTLERYELTDKNGNRVKTDQYFKSGYGKMYLMR